MSFHLSYAALALALSHFLVPTYAQTPTTTTNSSSTTTNTTNTATPTASYGFTYPVTSLDSKSDYAIQVNTKDSLNITWTYDGTSEEAPTLYLDCWLSNKTLRLPFPSYGPLNVNTGLSPDLETNLTSTLNATSPTSYILPFTSYATYGACQLILRPDTQLYTHGANTSSSVIYFNTLNDTDAAQTWSIDNKAKVLVAYPFPTPSAKEGDASREGVGKGGVWGLVMGFVGVVGAVWAL